MSDPEWHAVADGVWVRRYDELDLSVGLIVGSGSCLVIDTRGDVDQGRELSAAVREITPHPWRIVYTHGHFDHAFGASAFGAADIWAHRNCRRYVEANAQRQRSELAAAHRRSDHDEVADALVRTEVVMPTKPVDSAAELDIGGRSVNLIHPGAAHTDHDLIVYLPDAGVVFVGDLVEHGAPPQFHDAYPLQWPGALAQIMTIDADVVVPGHGELVDRQFVAEQQDELAVVADLCRSVWAGNLSVEEALTQSPYPPDFTRPALSRPETAPMTA